LVNESPDEAVTLNEDWNEKMPDWKSGSHIYPIDGAAHDVATTPQPWAYRHRPVPQVIVGVDPDPALAPEPPRLDCRLLGVAQNTPRAVPTSTS